MYRRHLLQSGVGLAALGALRGHAGAQSAALEPPVRLSIATYSLRSFRRDLAIRMIRQMGVEYADVKEFHLPYADSPKDLAEGRKKFDAAGIRVIAGGTIALKESDAPGLRPWFEYAQACGFPVMVASPTHSNLGLVEKLAQEFKVRVAIHNHGPEDKEFPSPQSVLEAVRNLDPRIGLCIDIGHTARAGADVVESIALAGPRLYEMHVKDLRDTSHNAQQVVVGEGILPIPAIFRQLKKMSYAGVCSLEYEIDEDNPLPGMQRSLAYMRGVLAGQAA